MALSSGQVWYRRVYLRSDHWRRTRARKFAQRNTCEVCGSRKHIDIHHASYANLWRESLAELITLCRTCHQREHSSLSDADKIKLARLAMQRVADQKERRRYPAPRNAKRFRSKRAIEYAYHCLRMQRYGRASEAEQAFLTKHKSQISKLLV